MKAAVGNIVWVALCKKVPNVLSHCHTKRRTGARGRTHPSFGILKKNFEICLKYFEFSSFFWKSRCHTKRRAGAAPCARPSFGMTTTFQKKKKKKKIQNISKKKILGTFSHNAARRNMSNAEGDSL